MCFHSKASHLLMSLPTHSVPRPQQICEELPGVRMPFGNMAYTYKRRNVDTPHHWRTNGRDSTFCCMASSSKYSCSSCWIPSVFLTPDLHVTSLQLPQAFHCDTGTDALILQGNTGRSIDWGPSDAVQKKARQEGWYYRQACATTPGNCQAHLSDTSRRFKSGQNKTFLRHVVLYIYMIYIYMYTCIFV